MEVIHPFRAIPGRRGAELGFDYALPVDPLDGGLRDGIRTLRARYRALHQPLRVEFNEEQWPGLAAALDGEGMVRQGANPLMTCVPEDFSPQRVEGVTVRWVDVDPRHPSTRRVRGEVDGAAGGIASIDDLGGVAELYGVITEPGFRRRGVAITLCNALLAAHFEAGGTMVFLDAENDGAAALYARLGFRPVGMRLTYAEPD